MRKIAGSSLLVLCLTGLLAATAAGQVPTFSMRLTEVNSMPIAGQGVQRMVVAPGDLLTIEVLLRDWSPDGVVCAAYQAEMNHDSFTSGSAGSIKPVGYDVTTLSGKANTKNAYIDLTEPSFVHKGEQTVAFVDSDTVLPGYRWMSVLFRNGGPLCAQDGVDHYCGTLKAYVSKDARGTFTYAFTPGLDETGILELNGQAVSPVETEALTLDVVANDRPCWIAASTPSSGAVDARSAKMLGTGAWKAVDLAFSSDTTGISAADFTVTDGTANSPTVITAKANGKNVSLKLSKPVTADAWTSITHVASGTVVYLGRLHGDVDSDGSRNMNDLRRLIDVLNRGSFIQLYHCDVDGSGRVNAADMLELVKLVTATGTVRLARPSNG